MVGIYKIISPSKRIYIGQSIDLDKRRIDYRYKKCQGQIRLLKSINKYGWENHVFTIIEECDIPQLNKRERYWQDYYNVLSPKGLNSKLTQSDDRSGILSDSVKIKISNSLVGNKHSEQRKENQRKAQLGKKRTDAHRLLISIAHKNKYLNKNERMKHAIKLRKPVLQFSLSNIFIKEFESAREAERQTNINISSITKCCNNKQYKSAGGFIWKYKAIEQALKLI